ncbi:MAG: arginine--tRNA ligase, partial [Pelagibacterales bacterium]|nr:arginine--tRNA ligase [Pelagibacterales bacterium]
EAAIHDSPAFLTIYAYNLVKDFNNYYQITAILTTESVEFMNFRLGLSLKVGEVKKTAMNLLGAKVPNRM